MSAGQLRRERKNCWNWKDGNAWESSCNMCATRWHRCCHCSEVLCSYSGALHKPQKLCQMSSFLPLCKPCTHLDSRNYLSIKGYWRMMDLDSRALKGWKNASIIKQHSGKFISGQNLSSDHLLVGVVIAWVLVHYLLTHISKLSALLLARAVSERDGVT